MSPIYLTIISFESALTFAVNSNTSSHLFMQNCAFLHYLFNTWFLIANDNLDKVNEEEPCHRLYCIKCMFPNKLFHWF